MAKRTKTKTELIELKALVHAAGSLNTVLEFDEHDSIDLESDYETLQNEIKEAMEQLEAEDNLDEKAWNTLKKLGCPFADEALQLCGIEEPVKENEPIIPEAIVPPAEPVYKTPVKKEKKAVSKKTVSKTATKKPATKPESKPPVKKNMSKKTESKTATKPAIKQTSKPESKSVSKTATKKPATKTMDKKISPTSQLYLLWDNGNGMTDPEKLFKKLKEQIKLESIKWCLHKWKKGERLPASAK